MEKSTIKRKIFVEFVQTKYVNLWRQDKKCGRNPRLKLKCGEVGRLYSFYISIIFSIVVTRCSFKTKIKVVKLYSRGVTESWIF